MYADTQCLFAFGYIRIVIRFACWFDFQFSLQLHNPSNFFISLLFYTIKPSSFYLSFLLFFQSSIFLFFHRLNFQLCPSRNHRFLHTTTFLVSHKIKFFTSPILDRWTLFPEFLLSWILLFFFFFSFAYLD